MTPSTFHSFCHVSFLYFSFFSCGLSFLTAILSFLCFLLCFSPSSRVTPNPSVTKIRPIQSSLPDAHRLVSITRHHQQDATQTPEETRFLRRIFRDSERKRREKYHSIVCLFIRSVCLFHLPSLETFPIPRLFAFTRTRLHTRTHSGDQVCRFRKRQKMKSHVFTHSTVSSSSVALDLIRYPLTPTLRKHILLSVLQYHHLILFFLIYLI